MTAQWSESVTHYELADGYALERADQQEFAIWQTLYRSADAVFLHSWERSLAMIAESQFLAPRVFWLQWDGRRVGGVIVAPNVISNLVLQPPFSDVGAALRPLKKLLLEWSDPRLDILASSVLPDQLEPYERLGFRRFEVNRCMIRPTERFAVTWEEGLTLSPPAGQEEELTALFYLAFYDLGLNPQAESMSSRRKAVRHYLSHFGDDELLSRASTCVRDARGGQMIGACLISLWEKWPLVFDLGVHPAWRGRGLATRMLQHALDTLAGEYPALRLFVTVGNPAESLYYSLGFRPGPPLTNLRLFYMTQTGSSAPEGDKETEKGEEHG